MKAVREPEPAWLTWTGWLLAVVLVAVGCSGGSSTPAAAPGQTTSAGTETGAKKAWTILLVQGGDNNLEAALADDLAEFVKGTASADSVNAIVLSDRSTTDAGKGYTGKGVVNEGGWTNARVLRARKGKLEAVAEPGAIDLGKPASLSTFLGAQLKANPAEHYALILADHGAGWAGLLTDDTHKTKLSLPGLGTALQESLAEAGIAKFDLIGLDACLMATIETAKTIAPYGDYLLASEELEPAHGWDYTALSALAKQPEMAPVDLGRALMAGYEKVATEQGTVDNATLSLVDLRQVQPAGTAVLALTAALVPQLGEVASTVISQRSKAPSYGANPNPASDAYSVDIGTLFGGLGTVIPSVAPQSAALNEAMAKLVVANFAGKGRAGSTGMAVYFPPTISNIRQGYGKLGFTLGWNRFLVALLQTGASIPDANKVSSGGPLTLTATTNTLGGFDVATALPPTSAPNVVSTKLYVGRVAAPGVAVPLIAEVTANLDALTGAVTTNFRPGVATLTDGTTTIDIYRSRRAVSADGIALLSAPLGYLPPGAAAGTAPQPVTMQVSAVQATGEVRKVLYFKTDERGLSSEFSPEDTGTFVAQLPTLQADGSLKWDYALDKKVVSAEKALKPALSLLPAGTKLSLTMQVTDFGENVATGVLELTT